MKNLLGFMKINGLPDQLLREFVSKGLWKPALDSCNESIKKREEDIDNLNQLKLMVEKQIQS